MPKILIVEDDLSFGTMLKKFLERHEFSVDFCPKAATARNKFEENFYELMICDLRLPDAGGLELLSELKSISPQTQVILMTGYAEVETAVSAMKKGAFDYISKPFTPEEVLMVIKGALQNQHQDKQPSPRMAEEKSLQRGIKKPIGEKIQGIGAASIKLQEYVRLVAPTNMSVLITGESGTGKEVVAKMIHEHSERSDKNFIAVDCGTIPKELASSEFFGHIKGSFTGAVNDKTGHFESANGGTLFLDEIGNLSYENQIKLLRAIQERKIKKVGSTKEIELDVRIITATNEDLQVNVNEGTFREDLYHRLNEFSIAIPSLRERHEDLMQFAKHFLYNANLQLNKEVVGFSDEVMKAFQTYSWPGNLRELQNVIRRAVLLSQSDQIEVSVLPKEVLHVNTKIHANDNPFSKSEYEKDRIVRALKHTNFNKSEAAKLLQITRKTLYNKISHYELDI